MRIALFKHAVTEQFPECALEVEARLSHKVLYLDYHLTGCIGDILLPVATKYSPAQKDGLWEHTCFEAFLGIAGQTQYCEFNFSPGGDWAAYAFQDYRLPFAWINPIRPEIKFSGDDTSQHCSTSIPLSQLPEGCVGQPLVMGLSAVLESDSLLKSWWAIEHAESEPDFHLRQGWIPVESLSGQL